LGRSLCRASTGNQNFILAVGCESSSPPGRDELLALRAPPLPSQRPAGKKHSKRKKSQVQIVPEARGPRCGCERRSAGFEG